MPETTTWDPIREEWDRDAAALDAFLLDLIDQLPVSDLLILAGAQ